LFDKKGETEMTSQRENSKLEASNGNQLQFATTAIHCGQEADAETGALTTPIFQTSTFVLEELGIDRGYKYARTHNPTRTALEQCLAALENAKYGIACASGLAAVSIVSNLLSAGDHLRFLGQDECADLFPAEQVADHV